METTFLINTNELNFSLTFATKDFKKKLIWFYLDGN
jgi:hypothetical protein